MVMYAKIRRMFYLLSQALLAGSALPVVKGITVDMVDVDAQEAHQAIIIMQLMLSINLH